MSILADHASPSRCTSFIIVSLLLVNIGLTTYIVYKEVKDTEVKTSEVSNDGPLIRRQKRENSDQGEFGMRWRQRNMCCIPHNMCLYKKRDALRIYGDLFKTEQEQIQMERKYFANPDNTKVAPTESRNPPSYYTDQVCNRDGRQHGNILRQSSLSSGNFTLRNESDESPQRRQKRNVHQYTYHGCCTSLREFRSPDSAILNHNGQQIQLVHFPNDRQHFLVDVCWHDANCGVNCGCRIQTGLFRALVHNPNPNPHSTPYLVRTIRLGGSCKCMNDVSP